LPRAATVELLPLRVADIPPYLVKATAAPESRWQPVFDHLIRDKGGKLADWAERASLPVADLEDTAIVRLALAACAKTLTGKAAAGSTQRRKRSVFYNALGYAVEQGHLPANPVDRVQWTAPAVAATVDRRVVVSLPRPRRS